MLYKESISIHALREEGDVAGHQPPHIPPKFLSTPSARRATAVPRFHGGRSEISIHALREEGDESLRHEQMGHYISIHALREEGDLPRVVRAHQGRNFYPRPPRGGRQDRIDVLTEQVEFLSTPSARRATAV